MTTILVLCTANQCRSPMGEALLRARLGVRGIAATIESAGRLPGGVPATDHAVAEMAGRGLDIRAHASRTATAELLGAADLIIGMAREHVRDAVVLVPAVLPRSFTLKELARRSTAAGPRPEDRDLAAWLASLSEGRGRGELLGASPDDDVADPIGQARAAYRRTADEIDALAKTIVEALWP